MWGKEQAWDTNHGLLEFRMFTQVSMEIQLAHLGDVTYPESSAAAPASSSKPRAFPPGSTKFQNKFPSANTVEQILPCSRVIAYL